MKKFFIGLFLLFALVNVSAKETVDVELKYVSNVYHNYDKNGLNYWGQAAYIYADGQIAYCLDITTPIINSTYDITDEEQTNNMILLTGYFGYGYNGETTLKDYLATQKLIWRYLGVEVHYTTKSNGNGDEIDIDDYVDKILNRIEMYETFPDYKSNYSFRLGSTSTIYDLNKINGDFRVINDSENYIAISNGNLIFDASEVGENKFYIEKNYDSKFKNLIYEASNSQKIMVIGEIENVIKEYSYNVIGGSINVNVLIDGDELSSGGRLNQNIFELYDSSNNLIGRYNYDNGILISNLGYGKYTLKHVNISDGYYVEKDSYILQLDRFNTNITKDIYIKPKSIDVTINKSYGNKTFNIIKYDEDVIYDIYDSNNNFVDRMVTDYNGSSTISLMYGDYKIVQVNVNNVEIYHEDIIITRNDFEDKIFDIYDEINKSKVRFLGLDRYTNEKVMDFEFELNDLLYKSNNGYYMTGLLSYGTYKISNIYSDGYTDIQSLIFTINNNSDFYIVNDEVFVDVLIYFEKEEVPETDDKLDIEIHDNDLIDDNEKIEEIEKQDDSIIDETKENVQEEIDNEGEIDTKEEDIENQVELDIDEINIVDIENSNNEIEEIEKQDDNIIDETKEFIQEEIDNGVENNKEEIKQQEELILDTVDKELDEIRDKEIIIIKEIEKCICCCENYTCDFKEKESTVEKQDNIITNLTNDKTNSDEKTNNAELNNINKIDNDASNTLDSLPFLGVNYEIHEENYNVYLIYLKFNKLYFL